MTCKLKKNIFNKLTFQLTWQDPGSHGRLDVRGEKQPHGPTAVEASEKKFWIGWVGKDGFQFQSQTIPMGKLYISLHENHKSKPNVGKYTSPMDDMGMDGFVLSKKNIRH